MGEQIVMLAGIAQAMPAVCESDLEIEGTQLLATQQFQSNTIEREGDYTEASLG